MEGDIDYTQIRTSPEMNESIKFLMKMDKEDKVMLYALKRIEELESENSAMKSTLVKVSEAYQGVGDFESTGENMVGIIYEVRKHL